MIVKLSYKGPKKKLKGDFEYDELVEFLKGGKGKKDLKDASGKKLTKAQKSALQSAAKVKWQWVSDDMRTQKVGMEDVLAPLNEITTEEKITVSDARGNHELSLYRGDTLGARRGYRGRYGRRRGGLGRRRRRRVGARWPGSPGRARYRHGGGMMYGYSHPYQWFPAFEGGYRGYGNAYPEMLPEVGEAAGRRRRRRRRDVGARWPGDPGRARYRHGGGVMYGYSNPYQSFPAMRGGIDYDYAYPQRLPVSGRRRGLRRRRRDVGARWPGDPGRARYRHGGGVMYGYSNPYQSFPAMRGGIDYDYAYPQSLPVSGPGYDFDY